MARCPDVDLVHAYLEHDDRKAFSELYRRYSADVRRAMSRALSGFSSAEVDEFAQELWARGRKLFEPYDHEVHWGHLDLVLGRKAPAHTWVWIDDWMAARI